MPPDEIHEEIQLSCGMVPASRAMANGANKTLPWSFRRQEKQTPV